MFRRTFLTLSALAPLALGVCLVAGPAPGADPKGDTAKAAAEIQKTGKLAGGANYWKLAEARHPGKKRTVAATPMLKPKAKAEGGKSGALAAGRQSSLTVVGGDGLPEGFGKGFTWDRVENEALLVMFINAADPLGIAIDGLQAGDEVQVLSGAGIASFSEDKGNPLASSIVGLVATGANIALGASGYPEVIPLVNAAEAFAKDQFKATNAKTKRRDTYGVDPGSGHKAHEEGGILVCLPEAGGTFYSGDGDHKGRWIKGDGVRSDEHLPAHVSGAFFPRQGLASHNTRMARQTGQLYVVPWDWKFEDNAGFYKVFVKLKKGNGPPSDGPILRKDPPAKPKP